MKVPKLEWNLCFRNSGNVSFFVSFHLYLATSILIIHFQYLQVRLFPWKTTDLLKVLFQENYNYYRNIVRPFNQLLRLIKIKWFFFQKDGIILIWKILFWNDLIYICRICQKMYDMTNFTSGYKNRRQTFLRPFRQYYSFFVYPTFS